MGTVTVANKAQQGINVGGYTVFGMAFANANRPADGTDGQVPIVAGYALTSGIDKDVWDEWWARNQDADIVKRGMILAHENPNTVKSMVRGISGTKPRAVQHNWGAARSK